MTRHSRAGSSTCCVDTLQGRVSVAQSSAGSVSSHSGRSRSLSYKDSENPLIFQRAKLVLVTAAKKKHNDDITTNTQHLK